jgi:hypothetical protein
VQRPVGDVDDLGVASALKVVHVDLSAAKPLAFRISSETFDVAWNALEADYSDFGGGVLPYGPPRGRRVIEAGQDAAVACSACCPREAARVQRLASG